MRNRVTLTLGLVSVGLVGLLVGCAPTARTNVYVNPTLQRGTISALAVLPIRNARLAPSEGQEVNRKVTQALHDQSPDVKIIGSAAVTDMLNQADLVDVYSNFVRDYAASGVPNVKTLKRLGKALSVDAILQGELVDLRQLDGVFGVRPGTTQVTMRLSILSTQNGDILWEGNAQGTARTATTLESAPPVYEALNVAVERLLGQLPPL